MAYLCRRCTRQCWRFRGAAKRQAVTVAIDTVHLAEIDGRPCGRAALTARYATRMRRVSELDRQTASLCRCRSSSCSAENQGSRSQDTYGVNTSTLH